MILIFVLVLMHIMGDFYFQPKIIAEGKIKKKEIIKGNNAENGEEKICTLADNKIELKPFQLLLIHCLIYTICFLPLIWFVKIWWWGVILVSIISITHFVIDYFSCKAKYKFSFSSLILFLDQFVHFLVLLSVGHAIYYLIGFNPWKILIDFSIQFEMIVSVLVLILPVSIIINTIMSDVKFDEKTMFEKQKVNSLNTEEENKSQNPEKEGTTNCDADSSIMENKKKTFFDAGMIIGAAERLIVLVLILAGQYAAIALIITVKTWARSNEIKTVPGFGNKYLVGTLVSLAIAIGIGFFCANIILK